MSKDKITKLNIVDWMAVVIVVLFGVLVVVIARQPERNLGEPALLTIKASNVTSAVCTEAGKKGMVYLNGIDAPAEIKDVICVGEEMAVTVEARGTIEGERMTFNGQRVLIGQKAELHGSFWAQGIITGFELK
jgi:hypothetical protein